MKELRQLAGGGYIMFLDPDDYLELNACEECVRILNTEKESDFIWFDFIYKRISGVINRGNFLQDQTFTIFEYCENIIIQNKNICYWNLCSKLIKTEIYLASFSFLEKEILNTRLIMAEDALIYFFIILNCGKLLLVQKIFIIIVKMTIVLLGLMILSKLKKTYKMKKWLLEFY